MAEECLFESVDDEVLNEFTCNKFIDRYIREIVITDVVRHSIRKCIRNQRRPCNWRIVTKAGRGSKFNEEKQTSHCERLAGLKVSFQGQVAVL